MNVMTTVKHKGEIHNFVFFFFNIKVQFFFNDCNSVKNKILYFKKFGIVIAVNNI